MDAWLSLSVLILISGLYVHGQSDLEQSIKEVFGDPKCTCIPATQCRRNRTNYGEGIIDERISCAPSEICCDKDSILLEGESEDRNISPQTPKVPTTECTCVLVEQCSEHFGEGLITSRKSCNPNEVCCYKEAIIKPVVDVSNPENNPPAPEKCICVPSSQCRRVGSIYGEGIINERNSCNPFEICCDRDAINSTSENPVTPITTTTTAPQIKCTCVPADRCRRDNKPNYGEGIINERMSCNPYEVCCEDDSILPPKPVDPNTPTSPTPAPPTPTPPTSSTRKCGVRNLEPDVIIRITDGESLAAFAEFPWMTAILEDQSIEGNPKKFSTFRCGASLIHPQVALTAAHCVNQSTPYKVRVGEWDAQVFTEKYPHEDVDIQDIVIHPKFYRAALFNDAALLYLKKAVTLRPNVDIICLPSVHQVVQNGRCFVTGWGKDRWGKKGKYATILRKIDVPIVPRDTCQELLRKTRLGNYFELHDSFVCAGGEEGKDACKGDGGSPLVCPIPGHSDQFFQVGIVAWGLECGFKDYPGVYGNVAEFREWIEEETKKWGIDINEYQYYDR